MATLVIKTNASQATDVTIDDIGVIVPNSGGTITFDEDKEIKTCQESVDLRDFLVDDAYGAGSSTLILNDGSSDIAQSDAINFLETVILPAGDQDYGVVKTGAAGTVETDITGDGTAQLIDWLLGSDLDANSNQITNLPLTPSGPTAAVSLQYVEDLFVANRSWKELVLVAEQFDSTNDALAQAIAFFLDGNPADSDDFTITDGSTTETFTFLNAPAVAFDVQIGVDADTTMANLVSQINTDSTLWSAVQADALDTINDGSGSSTSGQVTVIYRTNQSSTSFDDRIYGTLTTAADGQYVNYNGELDYNISTNTQLPSADPAQKEFGIGYATADLLSGQTHLNRQSDETYTWDSDAGQWNISGFSLDYGLVGDIQSLGSALAAGTSNRVARADHVHTHGDRGGDGAGSQHDADQIDVEGSFTTIGAPDNAENIFSNIEDLFNNGAKAGRFLVFGSDQKVPGSGTLFLETTGGVVSSSAGYAMLRAGTITGASFSLDQTESANTYNVSIRVNGTEQETLAIGTGVTTGQATNFTATYAAGDTVEVALERQTGSGSSDYDDVVVLVEVVDD